MEGFCLALKPAEQVTSVRWNRNEPEKDSHRPNEASEPQQSLQPAALSAGQ